MTIPLADKNVLVVGLARSGLAAANLLLSRGARVRVTDLAPAEKLSERLSRLEGPVRLRLGEHRLGDFLESDLIVVSPGVPHDQECLVQARRRGVPVWPEVELGYRFLEGDFIGVTGSNGKTTTTTLIGELLRQAGRDAEVAGNIGKPLSQLARHGGGYRTYVLELSSFQLEAIDRLRCRHAIVLNVTADHLDRHGDLERYAAAKERIFNRQQPGDFAILNGDDTVTAAMAGRRTSKVVFFSRRRQLEEGVFIDPQGRVRVSWDGRNEPLLEAGEVRLRGSHNLENVLAATAAGFLSGVSAAEMAGCFRTFAGVEHRLEHVARIGGVEFYNDSKATNVDSACKALEAFPEPLVAILGGRDKGADFRTLRPALEGRVRTALLLGEAAPKLEAALAGAVPLERCTSVPAAVRRAFALARPGDIVLLAPACASFDQFEDYEHRGRVFKEAVRELARQREGVDS